MDPNNSQPTGENPNLSKLEEDLDRLTKEAAATTQPTPETPVQSSQPETVPPLQSQPLEVPSAPAENVVTPVQPIQTPPAPPNVPVAGGKKGISLMTVAMVLLIVAVIVAVSYVVYTKFINPTTPKVVTPVQTPTPIPVSEVTLQASTSATPDPTADWKTYTSSNFTFKYPSTWLFDSGNEISTSSPKIRLLMLNDDSMYNECMKLDNSQNVENLIVKSYSRVPVNEACASGTDEMEKWIVSSGSKGYGPGIQYFYNAAQKKEAETFFDEILSTFKFNSSTPSATLQ